MSNPLKNSIITAFQLNGFSIRSDACDFLTESLEEIKENERESWLDKITDWLLKENLSVPVVEKHQLEAAILECCRGESDEVENVLTIFSAFEVPQFYFDLTRKKFLPLTNPSPPELYNSPIIKGAFYRYRYTLLYQRTLRNKLFRGSSEHPTEISLCTVDSLLSYNKANKVVILGMVVQLKEDKYYLEDPSGIVQLDLTTAIYHDGLFAETCFVLAEGWHSDGVLHVQAIGLPPSEPSAVSRIYFGSSNTFGGPLDLNLRNNKNLMNIETRKDAMFVIMSDIWLDQPKVLLMLDRLFGGYSLTPPTAFILMGNFISSQKGSQHFSCLRDGFKNLADIVSQYPGIANTSKFIIIPGPIDLPSANILPRPEFPEILLSEFKNCIGDVKLATNPCRIRYCTQEIVLIRENILTKLCRNTIHFPEPKDIPLHFVKTIISEAHLTPLSLNICPVYWNYDAALHLYPCPDMIVVGEEQKPFVLNYNSCNVMNPGSFSKGEYTFKVYYPSSKEIEDCQIPEEL